jgi:dTDP-4-amino-4,6-dideoxygalactose transaminase
MHVPLLDLAAQLKPIEAEVKAAVHEVIESTRYILGPKVEELEQRIAAYVGARYGIGVSSGTDALLVALMALEVGTGDIVLTSAYSFFATAGAVARLGATPAFVDIDPQTYNLCPESLRKWFHTHRDQSSRVKAIIPVHLFGQCADMDPILALAQEHGSAVIEDAAQAIGARYPSAAGVRRAGAMGTLGCFSFFPSKNLGGIGDGGMVVTDNERLADRVRQLRNHGAKPKYHHALIGGNFRLDPVQAAVLLVKLPHLEQWHHLRQQHAQFYDAALRCPQVQTPVCRYEREYHIYNQYVIRVETDRNGLRDSLNQSHIGCEVYYPVPFHEQQCFAKLGYKVGDLPHSEHAARQTLALPIYPELTEPQQSYVVQKVGEFYA